MAGCDVTQKIEVKGGDPGGPGRERWLLRSGNQSATYSEQLHLGHGGGSRHEKQPFLGRPECQLPADRVDQATSLCPDMRAIQDQLDGCHQDGHQHDVADQHLAPLFTAIRVPIQAPVMFPTARTSPIFRDGHPGGRKKITEGQGRIEQDHEELQGIGLDQLDTRRPAPGWSAGKEPTPAWMNPP
jgi:hypothetical protein